MNKKFKFTPKQWVLVRDADHKEWILCQYSHFSGGTTIYPYVVCGGGMFTYCIPYEGNEHLLGTTDPYEEPYEPKDGDFLVRYEKEIVICKNPRKDEDGGYRFYAYTSYNEDEDFLDPCGVGYTIQEEIRPATEGEKQLLLSKLHENGKDWDAEKKEVVDWKWIPNEGDSYYYPCLFDKFIRQETSWMGDDVDQQRLSGGWVIRSEEECKSLCDKLNEAIKNVK